MNKTRLLIAVLLSALPILALDSAKDLTRYGRQTWQTESGLPQNTVHAILQSYDGYMWFGTEGGLVRFDGLKFLVFDSQNTSGLRSNNVRSLVEDASHALWVGTADGLTRFSGSNVVTFTTHEGLPSNNIWSVFEDRSGGLWAVTAEGLAQYQHGRFRSYGAPQGLSINVIAQDNQGPLWLGTQHGIRLFADGRFSKANSRDPLPADAVQALLVDRAGCLWIGTSGGLSFYQNGTTKAYTEKQGLPGNRIAAIYQDREGSIWVSTDAGLARIENGKITRPSPNDPLFNSLVLSIFEDREGSLWLGTESAGLTMLHDEKFTTYTSKEGLSQDLVRCIFQDRTGVDWVGTDGGLDRLEGSKISSLTTRNGLSSNVILALAEDNNGALLAGTPDGLNILRNGRVTTLTSADGLPDDFVRSVYSDTDGSVWIGTRHGLTHWIDGTFKTYTQADGLGSDFVGALLRDTRNNLWIGTLRGLTRLHNGEFRNYTIRDGLSSNVITALYEDAEGVLWIGTQDGGLNRFRSEKFSSYPSSFDIPNVIYGILEDEKHDLWLTSKTGIFRIGKKDLNAFAEGRRHSIASVAYGTADGLRVSECSGGGHPSAFKNTDGSLWFSTLKGLATIDPKQAESNRLPPPVALESVSIDDRVFAPGQARDVPPGHSRFAFEYAGLSFIAPYAIRFRYRLDGFDKGWIDADTRRVAYYTNVPPGKYRFRVQARNSDSGWNENGAAYTFRLRPLFHQTYWFDFLLFLVVILLAWVVYRWRVSQVEAQFSAVLAERNRIAREIHDTLAQGFVAVSLQLELLGRMLPVSTESAQELLAQIRTSVKNSLSEARRSIWQLRSQASENQDLASKLSMVAAQTTSTTPVKVKFEVLGSYRPVPHTVENELLSIGQEAVTNAVRHARAHCIDINLSFEAKKLRLTIVDDGCGFTGQVNSFGPDGHFGLQGMRERAEQIEAELSVTSAPGQGTRVCVERMID